MPSILSKHIVAKLLGSEWSFGYNCYEVGHTWTPSCTEAALEISYAAGTRILPLYALLYGFTQVAVMRRLDAAASWETIKSIVRSTSFIFFHIYSGSIIGCTFRNTTGRFYYRLLVLFPSLLSSYMSILIEKPSRRQALAFYLLNMASEVVYRMAVNKGYLVPIRYGETLLFASSLAAWYYLIKKHGFGHDPVSSVAKVLVGREEAKSRRSRKGGEEEVKRLRRLEMRGGGLKEESSPTGEIKSPSKLDVLWELLAGKVGGRHASCPHDELACFYYVVKPIPTRFLTGCLIQTALKLSSQPMQLINDPIGTILRVVSSGNTLRFGLFVTTLVSSGRLTSCLLRRYSNSNDQNWHACVSGFVAGLSMLWSPRSSLSMYIMWKAIEQYYLLAASQGKIPYFNLSISTIYSFSAAALLYTFALEPSLMRPSYMKFLDRLSDHKLHQLNRMVLDVFGTDSSKGYEDYFPDLNLELMSNQFKELIFNWMIQPY
uniref:Transmembrane protein 135 n=2 Tax=Aceria tosichella TaxID=561515 RepID=A0A6G1SFZ0_9ACAR